MSDLTEAVEEIRDAYEPYRKAEDYFSGQVREVFASPAIRRRLESTGMAYRINLARRPVAAVLERLKLASVSVVGEQPAVDWWAAQWARNAMDLEAREIHHDASVFGDSYLMVWPAAEPDSDEMAGMPDESAGPNDVDMFVNSPLTTRIFYDSENPRRKSYAAKVWPEGDGLRVTLYYCDRIERWVAKNARSVKMDSDFTPYGEDGVAWPTPNPFGCVPMFHFRNARPYGEPEHLDAYGPQDAITKLVVTQMSTTDFHGFPQRFALLGEATDDLGGFDDDDETDDPRDNVSELRAGAGELWSLRNVKSVGQFEAADVANFLQPIAAYTRLMSTVTGTPLHFFEPMGDAPSGESLRAIEAPLVMKVEERQTSYGPTWMEAGAFALKVAGMTGVVDVRWQPTQTINDAAGWMAVKAKYDAGVPKRQCLIEAGYTAEQVDPWLAANAEDDLKGRIETLAVLGAAVSGLSSGAAVNIVTHEQVTAILDKFLALDAATEPPA